MVKLNFASPKGCVGVQVWFMVRKRIRQRFMCINKDCQSEDQRSIEDHRIGDETVQTIVILQIHELDRFEESFGIHPEMAEEVENRLIDVLFQLRLLCWSCAKPEIEKEMSWNFSWLDCGIPLEKHAEVYEFISDYQPLDDEWNNLLARTHCFKLFEPTRENSFYVQLEGFIEQGVTPQNVVEIAEWFRREFRRPINSDELVVCFDEGYRTADEMDLLNYREVLQDIAEGWNLPSKSVLVRLGLDGKTFKDYEYILSRITEYEFFDTPQETEVERLILSGIELDRLREIDEEFGGDPLISEVMSELDNQGKNSKGESVFDIFTKTVSSLSKVSLGFTTENIAQYWDLSGELILHIVDNGLLSDEVLRIARLVEDPVQLDGWLKFNENVIEPDEIQEWIRAGFEAEDAVSWKEGGFDAVSATGWRMVVDNPGVARRRLDAGFQLPELETDI